jgi:acetyl esterase/lipase
MVIQAFGFVCSSAANAEVNYTLVEDVAYGDDASQKLDVYLPKGLSDKSPVVIFYHGGFWTSGDKKAGQGFAETLVANGIIAVSANYRLYPNPENTLPYFMADAARVAKWVKDNIDLINGDTNSVYLSGFSAGAYIAAMLSINEDYFKTLGLTFKDFAGTIASAGTYNFYPIPSEPYITIFKDNEWASELNRLARGNNQPILFLASKSDEVVAIGNAESLVNQITALGGPAQLVSFDTLKHHEMSTDASLVEPILNFIWSTRPQQ